MYKVGILFCGGCNCYFDREVLYAALKKEYEDRCDFCIYNIEGSEDFDLVVLINGCQSECLMNVNHTGRLLLVNNTNFKEISNQFGRLLIDIRQEKCLSRQDYA